MMDAVYGVESGMAPIIDDLTPQSPINALAVPPPIENTWTRISKIVRGLDEAKVKDYKEDIDTILVFVRTILDSLQPLLA